MNAICFPVDSLPRMVNIHLLPPAVVSIKNHKAIVCTYAPPVELNGTVMLLVDALSISKAFHVELKVTLDGVPCRLFVLLSRTEPEPDGIDV